MKVAEPSNTLQAQKTDSTKQFGYYPVLGMNVLGRKVPIAGDILLGANRVKTGVFFAGWLPDYCNWHKECHHEKFVRKDLLSYINAYVDKSYEYTSEAKIPYTITKLQDYFYEAWYNELDYEYASHQGYINPVGCSAISNGNLYGRNLDWHYDETAEFLVRTPHTDEHLATIGVAGGIADLTDAFVKSNKPSELYKLLPFRLYDGMNEKGVVASTLVVPSDKGENEVHASVSTEKTISVLALIRYILDNFQTAEAAVSYIRDHVDITFPQALHDMGYEVHFLVADQNNSYAVEFVNNATVVSDANKLTNFYIDGVSFVDGRVYTPEDVPTHLPTDQGLTDHAQGLERYNIMAGANPNTAIKMRNLMNSLKYTKAYDPGNAWYTEFTDGELTVDSPASDFTQIMQAAHEAYLRRQRNGETWQTVHSVVYDMDKLTMNIIVQENAKEMTFKFEDFPTEYKHTVRWTEHVASCDNPVVDGCGRTLSITDKHEWWTGIDYYQADIMKLPDENDYGYPECEVVLAPQRGKDGVRKPHAKNCLCKECGNERRI